MGREIVYCNQCGDRITATDFEKGRAVTLLGKNYCRKCMKSVVQESKESASRTPEEVSPPTGAARVIRLPKNPPRAPDTTRRSASATGKLPLAEKPSWLPRDPSTRIALLVGALILIIALVLLAVVFARGGEPK